MHSVMRCLDYVNVQLLIERLKNMQGMVKVKVR